MNMASGALLLYTAVIVPVQIFVWSYEDPCVMFPTLYFDILVDLFFMVGTLILIDTVQYDRFPGLNFHPCF